MLKREMRHMLIFFILLRVLSVLKNSLTNSREIDVTTSLGVIRGNVLSSRLGVEFFAFRGIRYAKPPRGDLRFKNPIPVEPWTNVLIATKDGSSCPQTLPFPQSEDCLFLNVYTKNLNNTNGILKPVIIYIHGGSLLIGSSNSLFGVGPENLMDRDIVLVSFNYRLGVLGFLSTGTEDCPGNAGFKDQVLALKWVRDHIKNFGGDPNKVTIMGQSAGGRSVMLHLVSPMSRGLFHNAIIMSGSTTSQWKVLPHQLEFAQRQAKILRCSDNESAKGIISCLKSLSAKQISQSLNNLNEFQENPILKLFPVIEPDFGQERFLIEDPNISFLNGNFQKVPIIAGLTEDEFVNPALAILNDESMTRKFEKDFDKLAPICFLYERDTNRSKYISMRLKDEFLKFPLSKDSLKDLSYLFADGVTAFGVHRFVHLAGRHTTIYYYKNTFIGRFSHLYYPGKQPYGVVHVDDLQYVIYLGYLSPLIKQTDPENLTIERMTRLWTNLASFGNPNNPNDDILKGVTWTKFEIEKENYLNIGKELKMESRLHLDRFKVWDELFPLPHA